MKNIHILPTDKPSRLVYNSTTKKLDLYSGNVRSSQCKNIYITSDEIVTEYSIGLYFIDIYNKTRHIFSPIYINKDTIAAGKFHTYMNNGNMCKKIIMTTDQDLIKNGVQAIDDEFLEWFVKNPSCEDVEINWTMPAYNVKKEYRVVIPSEEPKQHLIDIMKSDEELGLYEQTKCYCGHTTTCDCGPEEPQQETTLEEAQKQQFNYDNLHDAKEIASKIKIVETLEEAALKQAQLSYYGDEVDAYVRGSVFGAKWQQEQDKLDEDSIRLDERCKCELENINTFSEGYDAGISQQERRYSEEDLKEAFKQSRQALIFEKNMPPVYESFEVWFEQYKKKKDYE